MAKRHAAKGRSLAEDLLEARKARATGSGGAQGLLAVSLPLVLGGCVAVGYFGGAWLDARYQTGFWMPIGVVFGLAAGFREAYVTVKRLNASAKWPTKNEDGPLENIAAREAEREQAQRAAIDNRPRPKFFDVPEPPRASFDESRFKESNSAPSAITPRADDDANDEIKRDEELLRYLRGEEDEDSAAAEQK